jgi:hypothetical protein
MALEKHGDQTLLAQGADQAIERHRGNVENSRTPFQTEATVGGDQSLPGYIGAHLAVTQDKMRQDGEHRLTRGALDTPNGKSAQANPGIMGVARQVFAAVTRRLMVELKTQGEEKGEDEFDKCLAIVNQLKVSGFILEIDGDRAVLTC